MGKIMKTATSSIACVGMIFGGIAAGTPVFGSVDAAAVTKKKQTVKTSKNTFKTNDGHAAFGMGVNKSKLHGKITYTSSNKSVATVDGNGLVHPKHYGKTAITIKAAGNKNYKSATKKVTVSLDPSVKRWEDTLDKLAKDIYKMGATYGNNEKIAHSYAQLKKKKKTHCAGYVSIAMQNYGLAKKGTYFYLGGSSKINGPDKSIFKNKNKYAVKKIGNKTIDYCYKHGLIKTGDIVGRGKSGYHTMVFKEKKNGNYYFYSMTSKATVKNRIIEKKPYKPGYKLGVRIRIRALK